jgi:serine/threonine protein kinase
MSVPRVFGRLLLLKLLARGGMGDVYLAATTGIEGAERPCVVKTVRRDHIHDGSFLARFLDEARVQAQLNHPGVAQVLEASTDENGEPYTVVDYVEGRSLSDVRQRAIQLGARVGWPEALAIGIEMAHALAHVHERAGTDGTPLGIVHRDLSPQNVMIGYCGEVKLIDFGTARGHNRRCHTVAGVVFAKPGYVAPEVARQQVGDGRIDIYALGIMLWELVAGRRFLSGDPQKHLEDAAAGKVVIPKLIAELDVPEELDAVIRKLTENDPDDRYTSAAQAAHDMATVLQSAPNGKHGERGVRARVQALMKTLWQAEPGRSRAEFAKLLKNARGLQKENLTPPASLASEKARVATAEDDASILPGTPYRMLREVGQGASGIVYEAEHVELGRKLALKVLTPEHASAKDAIDRFRREARAIAALSHPNLSLLYDFGRALDGRVFLAMELLEGETLDRRLTTTRGMDWREAVELAIEVTKALEAAHGANLVHRDLKPANLFLTRKGELKLLDFGVALALSDTASSDEKRQRGFAIFGTPEYMAPEQVAGETVDGRCDLYALGCVLYELTTGAPPFEGTSSVVVMGKQLREVAEAPRVRAPQRGIPASLDDVIMTALAKSPENRFASAQAMREALEATLVVKPAAAPRIRRFASRAAAAAVLGVVAWVGISAIQRQAPSPPAVATLTSADGTSPATPERGRSLEMETAETEVRQPVPPTTGVPDVAVPAPPPEVQAARVVTPPRPAAAPKATESSDRHAKLVEARAYAKQHPSETAALKAWAQLAMRAGEFRDARRAADLWALHDGSPEPRIFLATVLEETGHRNDARAVLEEVLEMHPNSTEARRLHARYGQPLGPDAAATRGSIAHR